MKNNVKVKESALVGEKYYYIKHESGLDVYVFPKSLSTSYALFGTRYGSLDNKFKSKKESDFTVVPDGIAHFLEHKMFENENGEDTFLRYARTGASANAYTSFNMTNYLFSSTDNFYESLEILLDFVTHPYFTEATVQKEQGIIGQEIRMGEDNPGNRLLFDMLKCLYEKHNVRLDIAGTVESISEITAELLYKCYNIFYNLNNMSLCVCGDVDVEKTLEVCDRILKKSPEYDTISEYAEEKPSVYKAYSTRKMQVAKPLFDIGVKITDISDDPRQRMKSRACIEILNDMLFDRASELYNSLYTDGVISKAFGYWGEHTKKFSLISISGESGDPDEVFRRFKAQIAKLRENGLDKNDFERCFRVAYANYVKGFDSTDSIANGFLDFIFDDGDILEYGEILNSVTFEDVDAFFKKVFLDDRFCLSTVYPID